MMVGEPFRPGEPWWRPDHSSTVRQRSLQDALQEMAWFFGYLSCRSSRPLTPKEQADRLEKSLEVFETARTELCRLDDYHNGDPNYFEDRIFGRDAYSRAHAALTEVVDRQQCRLKTLRAMGSSSKKMRRKFTICIGAN
jgi:hypothetical protein